MHIAVTGSRGLIGGAIVAELAQAGHRVTRVVRGTAEPDQVSWDPEASVFDASCLAGVDAVIHLAGESIARGRWTAAIKERILASRANGTRVLCEGLARMAAPPAVLVSASAIGYYGSRGDQLLSEGSEPGDGFLPTVVREWEAATGPAAAAGTRVVLARFGVVLSPRGGALKKMLTPFQLGLGGILGSGRQYLSWIALNDAAGAVHHALAANTLHGPVNVVAPYPVTNAEFTKTLGRVLGRPTVARVPAFAARLALGEMADALLLASTRVHPGQLLASGYPFRCGNLEETLRHLLPSSEGRAGPSGRRNCR
ncbi:MAG: TIGR01777 family protein [Planctomycetes bacterium]|nr:TIGR01777 family protein [Planctomycetota bacterium]